MTTADAILAFTRRCLDQDELTAKACGASPETGVIDWEARDLTTWSNSPIFPGDNPPDSAIGWPGHQQPLMYAYWREDAAHIARHDPARVLADIDAKRRQLGIIEAMLGEDPATTGMYAHRLLQAHAAAYHHHPGYQPEWNSR